jgi:hypothetical protein
MKKLLILMAFVSFSALLNAQVNKKVAVNKNLQLGRACVNPGSPYYNPVRALALFRTEAEKGNAEAMNALGVQYSKGLGTRVDIPLAVAWFERAGKAGYSNAWNNLGYLYKEGASIQQDYTKAVLYFGKGAKMGNRQSIYMIGYMSYKGLGIDQDYTVAYNNFKKSALLGSVPAMYFLGLSFRNGYGIEASIDSAKYWLELAKSKGDRQAVAELSNPIPENHFKPENQKETLEKIKNHSVVRIDEKIYQNHEKTKKDELAGDYNGFIIRYDWSGKHVIGKSLLSLRLERIGRKLHGTWTEEEAGSIPLTAMVIDSNIVFNGTSYSKSHHYRPKGELLEFKDASLQLMKNGDIVYLTGNLKLWSPARNEPGKPAYIRLTRIFADEIKSEHKNSTMLAETHRYDGSLQSQSQLFTYPNPFTNQLTVSFSLDSAAKVTISLISVSGVILSKKQNISLGPGKHMHVFKTEHLPTGSYLVKIDSKHSTQSKLVIKY